VINIRSSLRLTLVTLFLVYTLLPLLNAQEEDVEVISPRSVVGEGIYNNNVKILIDGQSPAEGSPWDSPHIMFW